MKKFLAMLLSVLMLVSCFAMTVSADIIYNDTELDWGAFSGIFSVGSVKAEPGETIVIPVSVENNPGIISLKVAVSYDASVLELVSAESGDFVVEEQEDVTVGSPSFGPIEKNPFTISWVDALSDGNNKTNGVVANLTFKVKEDAAEGDTEISVSYNPNDVFDYNTENVAFVCKAGTVTVSSSTPGDTNGDGKINIRDLGLLQQHLNSWTVDIDLDAADVNNDGKVNIRDLGLLQQYLNNWKVELI